MAERNLQDVWFNIMGYITVIWFETFKNCSQDAHKASLETDLWQFVLGSETLINAFRQKHGQMLQNMWSQVLLSASTEVGYLTQACVK